MSKETERKILEHNMNLIKNAQQIDTGNSVYNADAPKNFSVQINPDTSISRGMFKPDILKPGQYKAHPVTIRALKKDIFMAGDEFENLEIPYTCSSCQHFLDLQFWHFCPFCEASFKKPDL